MGAATTHGATLAAATGAACLAAAQPNPSADVTSQARAIRRLSRELVRSCSGPFDARATSHAASAMMLAAYVTLLSWAQETASER